MSATSRPQVPDPAKDEIEIAEKAKQLAEGAAGRVEEMKDLLIPTLLLVVICFVLLSVISSRDSGSSDGDSISTAAKLEVFVVRHRWHQLSESMKDSTWFNRLSLFTGMVLMLIGVMEIRVKGRDVPLRYIEPRFTGVIAIGLGMILMLVAVLVQQSLTKWSASALNRPVYVVRDSLSALELQEFFGKERNKSGAGQAESNSPANKDSL